MEGGFKSRLDEVFGALGSSQSTSWSVSGAQLDRRQWKPAEQHNSDEDEVEEEQGPLESGSQGEQCAPAKRFKCENEDDEVEAMVGLDSTLDFEDEEDDYDKVAVGREGAGDRVYTSDLNSGCVHPRSFREAGRRDDRALHRGAAERLAEDAREAELDGSADVYKRFTGTLSEKRKQGGVEDEKKRVRFEVEQSSEAPGKEKLNRPVVRGSSNNNRDRYKGVPDHVRNPEKYTHYTLDWTEDENSKSNASAWRETMNLVGENSREEGFELPEHITFVPRSKEKTTEKKLIRATPAAGISIAGASAMEDEESDKPRQLHFKFSAAKSYRSRFRAQGGE